MLGFDWQGLQLLYVYCQRIFSGSGRALVDYDSELDADLELGACSQIFKPSRDEKSQQAYVVWLHPFLANFVTALRSNQRVLVDFLFVQKYITSKHRPEKLQWMKPMKYETTAFLLLYYQLLSSLLHFAKHFSGVSSASHKFGTHFYIVWCLITPNSIKVTQAIKHVREKQTLMKK